MKTTMMTIKKKVKTDLERSTCGSFFPQKSSKLILSICSIVHTYLLNIYVPYEVLF